MFIFFILKKLAIKPDFNQFFFELQKMLKPVNNNNIFNYFYYRMDPNGIDVKLNRFGLNDVHPLLASTEFPSINDGEDGELER